MLRFGQPCHPSDYGYGDKFCNCCQFLGPSSCTVAVHPGPLGSSRHCLHALADSASSLLMAHSGLPRSIAEAASSDELARLYERIGTPASIAVVGSGGNVLFRGHGAAIDEHDVIIRVNGAVTAGYEHDVGFARSGARGQSQLIVCWHTGCGDAINKHQFDSGAMAIVSSVTYSNGSFPSGAAYQPPVLHLEPEWMGASHHLLSAHGARGRADAHGAGGTCPGLKDSARACAASHSARASAASHIARASAALCAHRQPCTMSVL